MKKFALVFLVCLALSGFCSVQAFDSIHDIFKYQPVGVKSSDENWQISNDASCSVNITSSAYLMLSDLNAESAKGVSAVRSFKNQEGNVYAEVKFKLDSAYADTNALEIRLKGGSNTAALFSVSPNGYMSFHNLNQNKVTIFRNVDYTLKILYNTQNGLVDYYLTSSAFSGMTGSDFNSGTSSYILLSKPSLTSGVGAVNSIEFKTGANRGNYYIEYIGVSEIPQPPSSHPRLYTNPGELTLLKQKIETANSKENLLYKQIETESNRYSASDALLANNGGVNYNANIRLCIESAAFRYLINKESQIGTKAKQMAVNFMNTATYGVNIYYLGDTINMAAIVYDWCYDCFTEAEKASFINSLEVLLRKQEISYPPTNLSSVTGHASGAQLMRNLLAAGIAVYGDRSEMYNISAGLFFRQYIEYRDFMSQSGLHNMGFNYVHGRYESEVYAAWLFKKMGFDNVFDLSLGKIPYSLLYARRPDGQLMRDGDTYYDQYTLGRYWTYYSMFGMAASYFNDPFIQKEYIKQRAISGQYDSFSKPLELLLCNLNDQGLSSSSLPLTRYFSKPHAAMIARTGWGSDSLIAYMKIGGYQINNHQHLDAGQFQIYYKGALAIDSGVYEGTNGRYGDTHDINYGKRTIAHNTMLIKNESEVFKYGSSGIVNDGGQRWVNNAVEPNYFQDVINGGHKVADVLAHEFGKDQINPKYSYIKGDLTNAYSSTKIDKYQRSMFFINFSDAQRPGALIVFDKVKSTAVDYKKYWLLHSINEPSLEGNAVTITNGQGRLVNTALIPESSIVKVGGTDDKFNVFDKKYNETIPGGSGTCDESGNWRVQITPNTIQTDDIFLNVMEIGNTGQAKLITEKIENTLMAGAKINNNIVMFSKSGEKITTEVSITIQSGCDLYFTDMQAGNWTAYCNNTQIATVTVTEEGSVASFHANEAGVIRLTPSGSSGVLLPPSDIKASGASTTQVYLTWAPSNKSDVKYEIYSGNSLIGCTYDTTFMINSLTRASGYNLKIKALAGSQYAESGVFTINTAPDIPTGLSKSTDGERLTLSWNSSQGATGYDIKIDNDIYYDVSSPYTCTVDLQKSHLCYVRAKYGTAFSDWSAAVNTQAQTFCDDFTGTLSSLSGWTFSQYGTSSAGIGISPVDNASCLVLSDTDYDTTNEYRTAVKATKTFAPSYGKVVFETKFMFGKLDYPNNNMELAINGRDSSGTSKQIVKVLVFSNGSIGYADYNSAEGYHFIPNTSPTMKVSENTWITLKIVLNTETGTYDIIAISDMYKNLSEASGVINGERGIFRANDLPFYSSNTVAPYTPNTVDYADNLSIILNRYNGKYYFDYIKKDSAQKDYNIGRVILTNQNNAEVIAFNKNDSIKSSVTITNNNQTESGSIMFAAAEYINGKLTQIKVDSKNIAGYNICSFENTLTVSGSNSVIKTYIWDKNSAMPLGKSLLYPYNYIEDLQFLRPLSDPSGIETRVFVNLCSANSNLQNGNTVYGDRSSMTYANVDDSLKGLPYIKTCLDFLNGPTFLKNMWVGTETDWMKFRLKKSAKVMVISESALSYMEKRGFALQSPPTSGYFYQRLYNGTYTNARYAYVKDINVEGDYEEVFLPNAGSAVYPYVVIIDYRS